MALYPIAPGEYQQVVWSAASGSGQLAPVSSWLLYNRDLTQTIVIGSDRDGFGQPDLATNATTGARQNQASLITALEQKTLAADDLNWWAYAPASNTTPVLLEVTASGMSAVSSPAEEAAQIKALGLATAANQGTQIGFETATATNTGTIATNTGNIETSSGAIETNTGTIAGNTGTIATDTTSIAASNTQVETNTGSIVTNTQNTITEVVNVNTTLGAPAQSVDVTTTLVNNLGGPGGVPLLHGLDIVKASSSNIPANTVVNVPLTFKKPGYFGGIWAFYSGATGSVPFIRVALRWLDPNTGNFMSNVNEWTVSIDATGGFTPIYIRGPAWGSDCFMDITNLDPAQPVSVFYDIGEVTHHIARDDWRNGSPFGSSPGIGLTVPPICAPAELILGAGNGTGIGASGTARYQLPVYAGQAALVFNGTEPYAISVFGLFWNDQVFSQQFTPGNPINDGVILLPRQPVEFEITNTNATAGTVTWGLHSLEYAS